jgi:hypothetical protein
LLVACHLTDGVIVHYNGGIPRIHDSRLYQCGGLREKMYPWERSVADKAYVEFEELLSPLKGLTTVNKELYNLIISSVRVMIERAIGRTKKLQILQQPWKHDIFLHPLMFKCVVNFMNVDLKLHPLVSEINPLFNL